MTGGMSDRRRADRSAGGRRNRISRVGYRGDFTDMAGNGTTRAFGNIFEEDLRKLRKQEKKKSNPKQGGGATPGMAAKGKAKVGEARREAGARRQFIEKRRRLLLGLSCILMLAAIVFFIYKLVFVVSEIKVEGSERYSEEEILNASGIVEGMNLYSFRTSSVINRITLNCPYIRDVDINRTVPNSVSLTTGEDTPQYYSVIYGEYKVLSAGLRVLETVSEEEIPEGLTKLKLPAVNYSVAGREINFADEKLAAGIREVLATCADSSLAERLTVIDLRDRFNIYMICDGRFKLVIGENNDVDYKLRVASKVLEDDMFGTENKFKIDLTTRGKTGVIMDNQMDVD